MADSWDRLLGDPEVVLDAEREAVDAIRRWVFEEPVLPCDRFLYLDKPEPNT